MKLPFNSLRLIIVSLSTLMIVGSVTWYAKSLNRTVQARKISQSQTGPGSSIQQPPPVTPSDPTTGQPQPQQGPTVQEPQTLIQEVPDSSSTPEDFNRASLFPKRRLGPFKPFKPIEDQLLFSVRLKYQTPLNNENFSDGLRQEFESNEISLSRNVTVSIEKKNSEWLIKEKKRKYSLTYVVRKDKDKLDVYREGTKHPGLFKKPDWQVFYLEDSGDTLRRYYEDPNEYHGKFDLQEDFNARISTLLFNIEMKFKNDLNNHKVSNNLRQRFQNNGIPLSQNVTVSVEKRNSKWIITDNNSEEYLVSKEADELNIYAHKQPDWTTMPWDDLRKYYILLYPDLARQKGLIWENESPEQIFEAFRQIYPRDTQHHLKTLYRTRYRLNPLK